MREFPHSLFGELIMHLHANHARCCPSKALRGVLQDHELLRMLATLLRGPSFTLAVTSCFRGVILHILALATSTSSSKAAARTAQPQQWRVRAALEAVAFVRLLDITPQTLRCHPHGCKLWRPGHGRPNTILLTLFDSSYDGCNFCA